jgi:hypothetical protein
MRNVWEYKPYFMSWLPAFVCLVVLTVSAQGANLKVRCGATSALPTINRSLRLLDPQGPNTVTVSGTCKENVLIQGFNRLTLISTTGATINDASGGTGFVVDIEDSTDIVLQGFTINGGVLGVLCSNFSVCRFNGNTFQGASVGGIQLVQSRAWFGANTIQNNGNGLVVAESSSARSSGGLLIQQNLGTGVDVDTNGSFASFGDTIQNNAGDGIGAYNHGFLLLLGTTITGNSGQGVAVLGQSAADFEVNNVVTGNGYDGVLVRDLSYAEFRGANTITGNLILDVECQSQFPVSRGALTNIGGGTTDCTEPTAPAVGREVHGQVRKPVR